MHKDIPVHQKLFNGSLRLAFRDAAWILREYPTSWWAFMRIGRSFHRGERLRRHAAEQKLEVPPILIASTTDACNLHCTGCYACTYKRDEKAELEAPIIRRVMQEASDLGINIVMLAGGEPLMSAGWLETLGAHKEMLGIVFTNGTLLDGAKAKWFARHRHILPAISIEGSEEYTDARRGDGVFQKTQDAMATLRKKKVPFGVSITVNAQNIEDVLKEAFIESYIEKGCRLFVFVEYVPVVSGTQPLVLSLEDKRRLDSFSHEMTEKCPAVLIPFPGNEEQYGGCLAAGRGFIHLSANGNLEPCPFAPFSDRNVRDMSLHDALKSKLLADIRAQHHLLKEGKGGCALWENREWVEKLSVQNAQPTQDGGLDEDVTD